MLVALPASADEEEHESFNSSTFSGLAFRELGPALTSGRVSDIAVHPTNHSEWMVATASGGVWHTINSGTTWTPVFDGEGSYSIGCVSYDPTNPLVVWVGTGENNSQRSVSFGDGVYRSMDGGKSWENVGLGDSQHIGKIIVHPDNGNIVYVAGPSMAGKPGKRSWISARTPESATSSWTRGILMCSTPRPTNAAAMSGHC
jgi:hypothetical protein